MMKGPKLGCCCITYNPPLHPHQGLLRLGTNLAMDLSPPKTYPTAYLSLRTRGGCAQGREMSINGMMLRSSIQIPSYMLVRSLTLQGAVHPVSVTPRRSTPLGVWSSFWSWGPSISLHQWGYMQCSEGNTLAPSIQAGIYNQENDILFSVLSISIIKYHHILATGNSQQPHNVIIHPR